MRVTLFGGYSVSLERLLSILALPLYWHFTPREAPEHIQAAGEGSIPPSYFLPQNVTHTRTAAIPSLHCCCAPCQEHSFPQTVEGHAGFKTKRLVSDMTSVLKTDLMTWCVLVSKERKSREVWDKATQLAKKRWHSEVCVCPSVCLSVHPSTG